MASIYQPPPNPVAEWLRRYTQALPSAPPPVPYQPAPITGVQRLGEAGQAIKQAVGDIGAQILEDPNLESFMGPWGMASQPVKKLGGKLTQRILKRADIRKKLSHYSPEEQAAWDDLLENWSDTTELLPQQSIPRQVVQNEARALDPELVSKAVSAPKGDPIRHAAIFQRARERVTELNRQMVQLSEQLAQDIPESQKQALQGQINALEGDAKKYLDWIFRTGSEHGRNLAMHQMMARLTFEDAYWLNRARRIKGAQLTDDDHLEISRMLQQGRKAEAAGDAAGVDATRIDLARKFSRLERTPFWEAVSTLYKTGLLSGPKTQLRNLGGNLTFQDLEEISRVPAVMLDMMMSTVTGQRTKTFGYGFGRAAQEGATRGLREAAEIMRSGATRQDLARMNVPRELNLGGPVGKLANTYSRLILRSMSAGDRPFRAMGYRRALEEQARSIALTERRQGKLGKLSVPERTQQLVSKPTASMEAHAIANSEFMVFANRTKLHEMYSGARAKAGGPHRLAMDIVAPFVGTPANIIARALEFSGVGAPMSLALRMSAAKQITNKALRPSAQKLIAEAGGRGLTGPALIMLGYKLAESGQMTGMSPRDPGRYGVTEAAGRMPGSILVKDKWQKIVDLSPVGNLLTVGATIFEESSQDKPTASLAGGIASGVARTALEQPMLSGMQRVQRMFESANPMEAGQRYLQQTLGSAVPTFMADYSRARDPWRREVRGQGTEASLIERTPFREQLPIRRDVLGRQMPASPGAWINPGIGSEALELTDEMRADLVKHKVSIAKPRRKWYEDNTEYQLREGLTAQMRNMAVAQARSQPGYDDFMAQQKRSALQNASNNASRMISMLVMPEFPAKVRMRMLKALTQLMETPEGRQVIGSNITVRPGNMAILRGILQQRANP